MAKGGNFEREISVMLSKWWTNGLRDDVFYRSDGSGSRFTVRKKKGKDTAGQGGDICASDSTGIPLMKRWSIECKTGYGKKNKKTKEIVRWDILDFLDSSQKETVLEKMWSQCERDAELTKREPVLIFRRNGRKPCLMTRWVHWQLLPHLYEPQNIKNIIFDGKIILSLKDFLEYVNPKELKKRSK